MKNIILIIALFTTFSLTAQAAINAEGEDVNPNNKAMETVEVNSETEENDIETLEEEIEDETETISESELEDLNSEIELINEDGATIENSVTTEENISNNLDGINKEDLEITYYYADGCVYCAKLDKYLDKFGGYEELNINKKEIRSNQENNASFLADAERLLGDKKDTVGTPFVVVNNNGNEIPLVGLDQATDFLDPLIGDEISESYLTKQEAEKSNKVFIFIGLLLIAIGIPAILYYFGNKK